MTKSTVGRVGIRVNNSRAAFVFYLCFFRSGVAGRFTSALGRTISLFTSASRAGAGDVMATFMGGMGLGSHVLDGSCPTGFVIR
jgi:hypothetical protein